MIPARRNFLIGATVSLITAPAIVRAASLMPVKAITPVFGQFHFLGFNIICMDALPTLVELQAATAYWHSLSKNVVGQWDERLTGCVALHG